MGQPNEISRRTFAGASGLGALAGLVGLAPAPASAQQDALPPLADPQAYTDMLARLYASSRAEVVVWYYTGVVYSVIDGHDPLRLFTYSGFELYRVRREADGGYVLPVRAITLLEDVDSGAWLSDYANPFTGLRNKVPMSRPGEGVDFYIPPTGGPLRIGKDTAAVPNGRLRLHALGDKIWTMSDRPTGFKPMPMLEAQTCVADRAQLLDPTITACPAFFTASFMSTWPRWMAMGDRPGTTMWHSSGRKLRSLAELPRRLTDRAEELFPGVVARW